ncbi:hypothetical protein CLF_105035 [Clonorchis sinensis]|uniref:Uncharacterized protein n=1 Tax=Clonorchis sinensis TaxID=79923 RepID=G7YCU7_CLOSI|nr:hypothetical protein CLF_105035 [Clonorchis sinensis]
MAVRRTEKAIKNKTTSSLPNHTDQCKCSSLIDVLATKLELLSKALTDANTKNAAIWTKVDKELSSLNEYLALSTPGPLAAKKIIQLSDAAIKTATASLVDRREILGRAVSVQKANPTIRRLSEDRPLDARKPGHSSSREEVRKKLPDGANSADPKLKATPIVVIAPCAPESTPRQTTATPDSSFYSTTADPSNSKGSDALEEASLTWTERPKYVQLSALLSVTDVKGATVNSTPKLQPSWIGSNERSQVVKPTGKPTTCADVDIGECCKNRPPSRNLYVQRPPNKDSIISLCGTYGLGPPSVDESKREAVNNNRQYGLMARRFKLLQSPKRPVELLFTQTGWSPVYTHTSSNEREIIRDPASA